MTVKQASERIGIRPSRLYQLVATRQIAHYRVGGKILFHEEDVTAFLAGCPGQNHLTLSKNGALHICASD